MTTKNNVNLEVSELSKLALKYIHADNTKEKNKLFLKIAEHYMPKILAWLVNVQKCDKDDFLQIYYMEVLKALDKWSREHSNFESYLYNYVISVYRIFMNNKKILKKGMECISLDGLPYDNIADDDDIWENIYSEVR